MTRAIGFSRKNLTEFVHALAGETTRIDISLSATGDMAIVFIPFKKEALVVREGESIVFGKLIPGSIPERHTISIQNAI